MSTGASPIPKRRQFVLILNYIEKYEDIKAYLTGLATNIYFIAWVETDPLTGCERIHVYTQFRDSVKLSIKKIYWADIEACKGSQQKVDKQIRECGKILDEIGKMRKVGGIGAQMRRQEVLKQ